MRILYISSSNIRGGGSIALFNIVKKMQQYGHTVHVVTPSKYGPFLEMLKSVKCPYSLIDIRLETYPKKKREFSLEFTFFSYLCSQENQRDRHLIS